MNKLDYYRAVLLGGVLATFFLSMFYVFTQDEPNKQPITPKSNFEVVDTYKGCDVVRWTKSNLAEYKYFLYCEKNK
jgi:hypothetical protein